MAEAKRETDNSHYPEEVSEHSSGKVSEVPEEISQDRFYIEGSSDKTDSIHNIFTAKIITDFSVPFLIATFNQKQIS